MPVEKIKEVVKEIKVPVFVQAPSGKHPQGSFNENFRNNFGNNFDDSFFAGSKNLEQIRNHFKKQKQQELINDEEDENFRRNINVNRQKQKNANHPQHLPPPPKFPYHLQQPNQNQPSINHQINHHQHNQIPGRQHGQNQPPAHFNHQQFHNQQQQFHNQQQQFHNQQQQFQNQQQNQEKPQHLTVSIPKNFNKNPVSSPQPPTPFSANKNPGNNQQATNNQQQPQNGPSGSFNIQQNFKTVHTANPVDDHVTEASTQYESYSPFPNIHYGRPIEHSQPQVFYEPLPAPQQQIAYPPPQQQVQYPLAQAYTQPDPSYQVQYQQQQANPQAFTQSYPQAIMNQNSETFQPSFGVPQQNQ